MNLLAIETATDCCSCALTAAGTLRWRELHTPRGHAERVLAMIDALLAEAGLEAAALDGIAFGRGPGSFTGLRIAAGVAQGLAWARGIPVAPVSTLQALALAAARRHGATRVLAALDARMGEVYWGSYTGGGPLEAAGPERVCPPEAVEVPAEDGWLGAGPGWGRHGEALRARLGDRVAAIEPELLPSARDLLAPAAEALRRGRGVGAGDALPVYLRDRVAAPRSRPDTGNPPR